ncbi:uncharacterized protein LOC119129757 [Syngnathus acus]|uniref:uncharacterized protein LOC119129757 n=1 Tax=Syngnathus acus TaxID=161584 RepID=UPI001885C572|nr:uncharacterized protein LOC119129757 [Syngnathus acus]
MWCYRKPGFEALLVAELQRQQQQRQFCDTLLRANGVSVPAHSCVLSAISPQLSNALSSSSAPPAGQEHMVEFGTVCASSLLHVVSLLYSGEMAGEGEREKQEAVSAAAKLGILGLVEVTRRQWQSGVGIEVGVQTDPAELHEKEVSSLRQEVSDGSAILGEETLPSGKKNALTETEEMQASSIPSCQSVATYETIDVAQFESLGLVDNHDVQLSVPTPLIYLLNEAEKLQTFSETKYPDSPWTAESLSLFSNRQAESIVLEAEGAEDNQFEQYQDDIPGFISHFLNAGSEEASHTGRASRKPRGRPRRRDGAERPARRPQARKRGRGRGRGGWMQTVDVQEVGVSKRHKSLLQRCGKATAMRTGQGGGATGSKLYLQTRHLLAWSHPQRRQRQPKEWDFCLSGQSQSWKGGGNDVTRGRRNKTLQDTQVSHTALCPAPPPRVDPPDHLDCLFEEVTREMDGKLCSSTPCCQPPAAVQNCSCTSGGNTHCHAQACSHGFTEVVATGRANGEVVHLEPQVDVDLVTMLDDFLQSLEQHGSNCVGMEAQEEQGGSRCPSSRHKQPVTRSSHYNTRRASTLNATKRVKTARKRRKKKRLPAKAKERIHESVRDMTQRSDVGGDKRVRCLPVMQLSTCNALNPVSYQEVKGLN